jgi:protein TonB
MFDDFGASSTTRDARKRMSGSVAAAVVLYGGISATLVAATATARVVVEEKLTQVEFAPPPPPTPPAPELPPQPTAAPAAPRPKAKRRDLTPPKEVPKEQLTESDKPLVAAGDVGPVDGFLNGVEGGKGTAAAPPPPPPPPKPEPLIAAVAMSGNSTPRYSAGARRKGVEGVVVVSFDILEDGRVGNVRIDSGPEDLRENVLSTVANWRFQPAKRGGKAVRTRKTQSIRFRLDDA